MPPLPASTNSVTPSPPWPSPEPSVQQIWTPARSMTGSPSASNSRAGLVARPYFGDLQIEGAGGDKGLARVDGARRFRLRRCEAKSPAKLPVRRSEWPTGVSSGSETPTPVGSRPSAVPPTALKSPS